MADKKISALAPAATPLAGTEVLPIVQSGSTVKVAVSNLTAGRSVSSGNFTVNGTFDLTADTNGLVTYGRFAAGYPWALIRPGANATGIEFRSNAGAAQLTITQASGDVGVSAGNLVVGTAGKGIDFSANTHAPGMTSELLDWYEEGTWTPSVGGDATYSGRTGYYTRIGRQVTITCDMSIDVLGTGSPKYVTGMPYQSIAFSAGSMSYFAGLLSNVVHIAPQVTPFNSVSFATLASAGASVTDDTSIFANGTRVIFTITYFV